LTTPANDLPHAHRTRGRDRWRGWFPLVVTRVTSTARHIPTARRTTATGRSPGSRINAGARRLPRSRSGRGLPDRQWRM